TLFRSANLEALDAAFVRWLQAPGLREHMACNFDPEDVDSGIHYQEAMAVILQDAASRGLVYSHIAHCLHAQDPAQPGSIILRAQVWNQDAARRMIEDRKSTRLNSSHVKISYAVFCLKKKTAHPTISPVARSATTTRKRRTN